MMDQINPNTKAKNIFDDWGSIFEGPHDWFPSGDKTILKKMLYVRKILIFKKIKLDQLQFWNICNIFGIPWKDDQYEYSRELCVKLSLNEEHVGYISNFSNKISKKLGDREMPWHADIPNAVRFSFPHRALYMKTCPNPEAGFTLWMNTPKAFAGVNDDLKRRWGMTRIVQHSWYEPGKDIREFPSMTQHPITGEYCPRVNSNSWIIDTKVSGESMGIEIVDEMLNAMEKQTNCVYEHHWDETDLIIYDNFPFVHRRTALDIDDGQERLMWRANIDHDLESKKLFEAV